MSLDGYGKFWILIGKRLTDLLALKWSIIANESFSHHFNIVVWSFSCAEYR
jgi:hypothetical protein